MIENAVGCTFRDDCRCRACERWVPIASAPGYEVSNLGRVRGRLGHVLKPCALKSRGGHLRVQLGRGRGAYVHHLVLEAFGGPRPGGAITRHLDGDPTNNRIENLAWGTVPENHADTIRHGRTTRGEKNARAKLGRREVEQIRQARRDGVPLKVLAERYGVRESCISRVATGKRWGHLA